MNKVEYSNVYNIQPTNNQGNTMTYIERLYIAIDTLSDMLDDQDGDFDIHNMIDTLSIRHDVDKKDLLDWYDNN